MKIEGTENISFAKEPKFNQINKGQSLVCRGLKYQNDGYNGEVYAQVEIVCKSDEGFCNFLKLLEEIKNDVTFTTVRITGDNFVNLSHKGITIGQTGFDALIEMFTKGFFACVSEFKFSNFEPEPTPMLAFVDTCLVNHPTLTTINF
jgi:hypothetical protein